MVTAPAFTLSIQADPAEVMVPGLRSLLFFAVILIFFTAGNSNGLLYLLPAALLLAGSLLMQRLVRQYRLHPALISGVAALLFFAATGNLITPLVLFGAGMALKFVYRAPVLEVSETGIRLLKTLHTKQYPWDLFSNVLIKDQLLTLDFNNNRILQLELKNPVTDETAFNRYCSGKIKGH